MRKKDKPKGPPLDSSKIISMIHLILILSLFLSSVGIWWGLPSHRGWAADEIIPTEVLDGIGHHFFSNNWYGKYPPFHYYLLSLFYAPFFILDQLNLLDISSLPILTLLFYIGRFLSVLMGTTIVFLVYKCGQEVYDRRASLFASLMTALIVPFVYYSKMTNLDVPYIFWFVLSLYFYIRILKNHQTRDYLLFSLTAILSICTKDQAYGLYVLAPLVIIFSDWMHKKKANRHMTLLHSLWDRNYLFSSVLAILLFFIVQNIFFNAQGFITHLKLISGPLSKDYQVYERSFSGYMNLLWQTLRQIQFSLGWPLFLLSVLGLLFSLVQKKKNLILFSLLVFPLSYYLFYISIILYNYDRFNIPMCIVLTFFGGKCLSDWRGNKQKFFKLKILLLAAVFAYTFFYSFSVDVMMVKDSRYPVEKWIKENIDKEALIGVATHQEYAPRLAGYKWFRLAGPLKTSERSELPDYVLFNADNSRRFAAHTPERELYSQFTRKERTYKLVFRYKSKSPWILLNCQNIATNLALINPEILLFKRADSKELP